MDGADRDLGWEDVSPPGASANSATATVAAAAMSSMGGFGTAGGSLAGQVGEAGSVMGNPQISDAVTSAMVNHFATELTKGSLSLWPQFVLTARRYFNVSHGYILRKVLWQLVPTTSLKKKSTDGEIGRDKDWTVRMYEGLEVEIEEPDMYIPVMGFATYVLLCGMIKGLQEQFHPDILYTYISFAVIILVLEVTVAKAALFMAGAVNAPVLDIAALFGYKFLYLCLQLISGMVFGGGHAEGVLYHIIALALMGSCGFALFQSLRRLARMQPALGQECVQHVHEVFIKVLPVMQLLAYYLLLPTWPKRIALEVVAAGAVAAKTGGAGTAPAAAIAAEVITTITTTIAIAAGAKT